MEYLIPKFQIISAVLNWLLQKQDRRKAQIVLQCTRPMRLSTNTVCEDQDDNVSEYINFAYQQNNTYRSNIALHLNHGRPIIGVIIAFKNDVENKKWIETTGAAKWHAEVKLRASS